MGDMHLCSARVNRAKRRRILLFYGFMEIWLVTRSLFKNASVAAPFWVMVLFLVLLFLTGGGARSDIQSLVILRPAAAVVIGYALWGLTWEQVRPFRFLLYFSGAIVLLVALHLIPLPPAIWGALPGRGLSVEIDRVAQLGDVWRPLSLVPSETWNALYALLIPAALLLLAIRLTREQRFALLPVMILLGLFSGFIGLLQAIGPNDSPLYLYRITNNGAAVGLFANRNHQAMMLACLFPMLAVFASVGVQTVEQARLRGWLSLAAGGFLVPLLLVTGSRAGLILAVIGLASVPLIYRRPEISRPPKRKINRFDPRVLIGVGAILTLATLTMIMSRAQSIDRIVAPDSIEELRFAIWPYITNLVGKYFPVGSGIGSFVDVYQINEPTALLSVDYVNHAHNDWLEILLTGGLPALILLIIAVIAWVRAAFAMSGGSARDVVFGKLGLAVALILALASVGDYPLRVPIMASFIVLAAIWIQSASANFQSSQSRSIKSYSPA